jgi:peroxiredoxin
MLKFSAALLCAVTLFGQPLASLSLSGRRAPSFSLPDSSLRQHDILDYRGKWLLLDFMKTDCPHCKELSKKLEGVMGKYRGKVEVLGVVLPPDNQQTVARYIMETKITSAIVFDSSQTAIPYFKATPTTAGFDTPHLFAIDPNGMIVKDWGQAAVETPGFLGELDQLLNKK